MRMRAVPLLLALTAPAVWAGGNASVKPMQTLHYFVGTWHCAGTFPASGRAIASQMRFAEDLGGKALVKHHADAPPGQYRAIESWGYDARHRRFRATILDNFGGTRLIASDGWHGDTLTWSVASEGGPAQRFVYVRKGHDSYRVDWMIARPGKGLVVGDTLTCRRQ